MEVEKDPNSRESFAKDVSLTPMVSHRARHISLVPEVVRGDEEQGRMGTFLELSHACLTQKQGSGKGLSLPVAQLQRELQG